MFDYNMTQNYHKWLQLGKLYFNVLHVSKISNMTVNPSCLSSQDYIIKYVKRTLYSCSKTTLEHTMPQQLNVGWKKMSILL